MAAEIDIEPLGPRKIAAGLLGYWRDCRADEAFLSVRYDRVAASTAIVDSELASGRLSNETAASVREAAKRDGLNHAAASIPVIVTAGRISPRYSHGHARSRYRTFAPLCIPASLDEEGVLHPDQKRHPYLARQVLDPAPGDSSVIGTLADTDAYYEKYVPDEDWNASWPATWQWAQRLWEAVTGNAFDVYEHDEANFERDFRVVTATAGFEAKPLIAALTAGLKRLERDEALPLLERALTKREPSVVPAADPYAHRGHLGEFGLKADQRLALAQALSLQHAELHAITGPPGTGKTTLLRTLTASLSVDAVLEANTYESAVHPLIVVTSANNNAVTNVLDALNRVVEDSPLGRRWIDGCPGYGLYHAAQGRADSAEGRHYSVLRKVGQSYGGQVVDIARPGAVEDLERVFLERFGAALTQRPETVDAAVEILGRCVRACADQLQLALRSRDAFCHTVRDGETVGAARRSAIREVTERISTLESAREKATRQFNALEENLTTEIARIATASRALDSSGWYEDCFSWMNGVKRRRWRRFVDAYGSEAPAFSARLSDIETWLNERKRMLESDVADLRQVVMSLGQEIARCDSERVQRLVRFDAIVTAWDDVCEQARDFGEDPQVYRNDSSRADELFDKSYRASAFRFAMRFWEGRFIQEIRRARERREDLWGRQDRESTLRRFRIIAMLYPVSVVTIYSLASRYDAWNTTLRCREPLFDAIDWVIVDEAGQVGPDLAGVALLLARRLIAVGDTWQLQPIFSADEGLARANVRGRFGALDVWDMLERNGSLAYEGGSGSAMQFAQACVSRRGADSALAGSILTSHFRCVPEIIAYSNDLVYRRLRALEPQRQPLIKAPYPAMGYTHVRGRSVRRAGSSRTNEAEARILTQFLVDQRETILSRYAVSSLASAVAIVTPYAAQATLVGRLIDEALRSLGLPPEPNLAIGTVYRMQGAEAKIVLYSHVLAATDPSSYVDSKPNLLNVAVSRAEDHFLFFGDLAAIDGRSPHTPTGLLATHLLQNAANALIGLPTSFYGTNADLQRLATLEAHVALLDEALMTAQHEVFIVSPFLSTSALESDDLLGRIAAAVARGVHIRVYTDAEWGLRNQGLDRVIRAAGADLVFLSRIHAKTLAIDDRVLYEGSFNWLSARRDEFARFEAGWVVRGPAAATAVQDVRTYFGTRSESKS